MSQVDLNTEKFKIFSSQVTKNVIFNLSILFLVLVIFHSIFSHVFSDYFLINQGAEREFHIYFFTLSSIVFAIYLISYFKIYQQVFAPLPRVLKRIQDIKNYKRESTSEDYFAELPDFWNLIEEEVLAVAKATGRRQRQTDRIRKAVEQILNAFPEATLVIDKEGKINYSNQAFKNMFIVEDLKDELYVHDLFREPQVLSMFSANVGAGTIKQEVQIALNTTDIKKNFIVYKTPFAMKHDSNQEQMVVFHDVTSSKQIEQMKADFVSNVSHELRTPMMSIQGYVQTLKEDVQSNRLDQTGKFFEIIESHVERLNFLINDLLQLSYLESEASLNKEVVDVKALTQKILKQFSLDLEKGQYSIQESYIAEHVHGDPRLIEQVLTNLLQNALRYTPAKTVISLTWKQEGINTILTYKDNGPGISEDHLSRVFERFYRIDPHRSRSRGGTGLGLSIVKHIMQKHGGSIEAKSELGHGLEFNCVFPVEKNLL